MTLSTVAYFLAAMGLLLCGMAGTCSDHSAAACRAHFWSGWLLTVLAACLFFVDYLQLVSRI